VKSHEKASSAGSSSALGALASPRAFVALLALVLGALLLTPALASAALQHVPRGVFGSAAQPTFGEFGAAPIAVDQSTGDVLVVDTEAGTLSRFHEDGTASNFTALGTNVISGLSFGFFFPQVAVDPTNGNIYVTTSSSVNIFDDEGNSLGELTESSEGPFSFPCGVAVDSSGSVYVDDFEGIHKYEPTGAAPVNGDNSNNFSFPEACSIAAGAGPTQGFIFVSHFNGSTAKLDSTTGEEKYELDPGAADSMVSVDPVSGHIFVVEGVGFREFNAAGPGPSEVSKTPVPSAVRGIAVNGTTGNLYVDREGFTKVEVLSPSFFFGSAAQPTFGEFGAAPIAVDQSTGDVLVVDTEAGTLSRFHEDGTASNFTALGTNVISGLSFGFFFPQVAVDPTNGNIYVTTSSSVNIFDDEGNSLGELTESSEGPFSFPCGVAVDSSGSVYVDDFEGIHKYEPTGAAPVNGDNSNNFSFPEACSIAAGAGPTQGFIFVSHFNGSTAKLDSTTGEEKYELDPGAADSMVSVDPVSGHIFVVEGVGFREFNAAGPGPSEVSKTPVPSAVRGIAVNGTTGNLYVDREGFTKVEVFPRDVEIQEFDLTINKTGSGTGKAECKVNGGAAEPCAAKYEKDTELELIATADSGSELTGLTGSGSAGGAACEVETKTTGFCSFTIEEDSEVTAEFTPEPGQVAFQGKTAGTGTGTLQCKKEGGGSFEACQSTYTKAETITLKAEATGGHSLFQSLTVTGSSTTSCSGALTECSVEMEEPGPVVATATFNLEKVALTVSKEGSGSGTLESTPAGINCGGSCSAEFDFGTKVKLKGTPGANTQPVVWQSCPGTVNGSNECEVTVDAAKEAKAKFDLEMRTLTIDKVGEGEARCKVNGGSEEPCAAEYLAGTELELLAAAAAHWQLAGWSEGSGSISCTGAANCGPFDLEANSSVKATFTQITHTFTVTKVGKGIASITCREDSGTFGTCAKAFNEGHQVTIRTTPAIHNTFVGYSAGSGSATSCEGLTAKECSFEILTDSALTATIDKTAHTLGVTLAGSGTGTVECKVGSGSFGACSGSIDEGSKVEVKASAAAGSTFAGFSAGTGSASACSASPCNLTLEADSTLTASFNANPAPPAPAPGPAPSPTPSPTPTPKPLKCKKGFKKKKVHGKAKCVKVRKHKGHKRGGH
jgi:hypothetical protein